jgi:hypothetical protein
MFVAARMSTPDPEFQHAFDAKSLAGPQVSLPPAQDLSISTLVAFIRSKNPDAIAEAAIAYMPYLPKGVTSTAECLQLANLTVAQSPSIMSRTTAFQLRREQYGCDLSYR